MFLLNSRLAFFSATPEDFTRKGYRSPGCPFSRSYGALLPSSLAEVRPSALGLLSPPTSVGLRYGHHHPITARLFLSAWVQQSFRTRRSGFPPLSARNAGVDLPAPAWPTEEDVPYPIVRSTYPPAPPLGFKARWWWCRNINLLSIAFGLSLRLRPD